MVDTWNNNIQSNGIMLDEIKENKSEKFFSELLRRGGSLFEVGFSPEHLFYQKKLMKNANVSGLYFHEDTKLPYFESEAVDYPTLTGREIFGEIAERIKNKEIPDGDFVFMSGTMVPNDKVYTGLRKNDVAEMGTFSGAVSVRDLLDRSDELGTHLEEFVHRAFRIVPELDEWRKNNITSNSNEEALMGAIVSQYFPNLAKYESERILNIYNININRKSNKKLLNKWIKQIEKISSDVLKQKKESK